MSLILSLLRDLLIVGFVRDEVWDLGDVDTFSEVKYFLKSFPLFLQSQSFGRAGRLNGVQVPTCWQWEE